LTIRAVEYLKESLIHNRFLKYIDFSGNKLSFVEDIFVKYLNYNYTIENIHFDCDMKLIQNILFRNMVLHRFYFFIFNLNFDLNFVFH
jgi:hypothetical protein